MANPSPTRSGATRQRLAIRRSASDTTTTEIRLIPKTHSRCSEQTDETNYSAPSLGFMLGHFLHSGNFQCALAYASKFQSEWNTWFWRFNHCWQCPDAYLRVWTNLRYRGG